MQILDGGTNLTSAAIIKLFGRSKKSGIKFYQDDIIVIGPEDSPFVKPNTITTTGIYMVNKYIFEPLKIFGYVNKTFDNKLRKAVSSQLSLALMEDDVTREQVWEYIDRTQWLFGGTAAHILNSSLSSNILNLPPKARKEREKLLKDNKERVESDDPQIAAQIGEEVTTTALQEMRKVNDPAMAIFDSGCGVDPYNNYRTMFVMKGPIKDNTGLSPTGYKTVTSNYNDGLSKEDLPKIADSIVTGAYARAIATADSGYSAKKYNSRYQRARLAPRGSDCHTTEYVEYEVREDNIKDFQMYHYIMEDNKPKLITPKNAKEYLGKVVKLRTPSCCKMKEPFYCNVCYGDRAYRLGIENVGNTFQIAAGSLLNSSLKSSHDITIHYYQISLEDIFRYENE